MPPLRDPVALGRLRARLEELGFTPAGVRELFGPNAAPPRLQADRSLSVRRLPAGEPVSLAVSLFLLDLPVPAAAAERALSADLERLGLADRDGDELRARVQLAPHEGLLLASDRLGALEEPDASPDHVAGVSPTSITLARLTVRRQVDAALDVGTGCGVQALLAGSHARTVLGTDINPRALAFAAFNAVLNDVANVAWHEGSLFDAVERLRFDLVVCNPPFVVSPDTRYAFRDSDLPADEVSRRLVRGVPAHLAEGGFAHVLCNWGRRAGEGWEDEPRRWVEASGCDALLLHHRSDEPLAYAASWLQLVRAGDPSGYPAALDRWLRLYREQGYEALEYGTVTLRRRSGASWVRAEELRPEAIGPSGAAVEGLFAARDFLAGLGHERALLVQIFSLADHRLEQVERRQEGRSVSEPARLLLEGGLPFAGTIDGPGLEVLSRVDGKRRVGAILEEVSDALGLDRDAFTAVVLPIVRRLVELGFLVPARPESRP